MPCIIWMGHGYYTWEFMLRQTMERHHIGLMDAVIILECIMPGPWMRQEPVNPGLHKAGRSNRNDDVESIRILSPESPAIPFKIKEYSLYHNMTI